MKRRDLLKSAAALPVLNTFSPYLRARNGRYQPSWASLDSRPSPSWYADAKFGIFIHWGVYSVPSYAPVHQKNETMYAEWYWHSLVQGRDAKGPGSDGWHTWQFHKQNYGADFPYEKFAPMFRAEFYDPDQWASAIAGSGAKYVALTSKHHEGFTLWRNAEANRSWGRAWNAVDIGPKRDVLLDLMDAGRSKGLHMGIYYSLYEWFNPLWLSDKKRFVSEHLFPQFKDVVTHAKPSIIFSDGEWELPSEEWRSPELLAWLFNESPVKDEVVIDDRWGKDTRHKHGGYFTTEYTSGMQQSNHPWEESRGMGYSYGYNRVETLEDYHSGRELIMMLIDIVSRGGNLLLDIGPAADGTIPVVMQERLAEIGDWLRPNGEAIYGTHAWREPRQWSQGNIPKLEQKEFMAPYDIKQMVDTPPAGNARVEAFFTAKDDVLYVIAPRLPSGDFILRDVQLKQGSRMTLLRTGEQLQFNPRGQDLHIAISDAVRAKLPAEEARVIKITGVQNS